MPGANKELVQLLGAMGGRQKAVDAINEVIELVGDDTEVVSLRQVNNWVYGERGVPALGRFYLLVAAANCGIDMIHAIGIFPALEPTAAMIKLVRLQRAPA